MEAYISAIKSNDLVEARKAFDPIMRDAISRLMEQRKVEIACSVMIEGEEPIDDDEDDEKDDKKKKNKEESDGADKGGDADEGDDDDDEDDD